MLRLFKWDCIRSALCISASLNSLLSLSLALSSSLFRSRAICRSLLNVNGCAVVVSPEIRECQKMLTHTYAQTYSSGQIISTRDNYYSLELPNCFGHINSVGWTTLRENFCLDEVIRHSIGLSLIAVKYSIRVALSGDIMGNLLKLYLHRHVEYLWTR